MQGGIPPLDSTFALIYQLSSTAVSIAHWGSGVARVGKRSPARIPRYANSIMKLWTTDHSTAPD